MPLPSADTEVTYPGGAVAGSATILHVAAWNDATVVLTDRTPCHPVDPRWPDQGPDRGELTFDGRTVPLLDCVIGATDGVGMVIWGTLLQRRVPPKMLGRVSSLDFFVSLAFMPVSFAMVGPLSKVVPMEAIFLAAGALPVVFAAVAMWAARMRRDELTHPLR